MSDCKDVLSLSQTFDDILEVWNEINNSDLPASDKNLQEKIGSAIKKLESITIQVSYLGLFSVNETAEDITTDSLKFLLLPALLGLLNLKKIDDDRKEILKVSTIYFKDLLLRCNSYQLTDYKVPENENENSTQTINSPHDQKSNSQRPSMEDLQKMAVQRQKKIERFKARRELDEKLANFKCALQNCQDDEVKRDYYLTLIQHFIFQCMDELDVISMEQDMLKYQSTRSNSAKSIPPPIKKPLQTFLLTKNKLQKEVFGAGYPSLPVLTVEEFFEQKVKEGWFPPPNSSRPDVLNQSEPSQTVEEEKEDGEKDEENRQRLNARDEWRDTHRTGWGNTYNRS